MIAQKEKGRKRGAAQTDSPPSIAQVRLPAIVVVAVPAAAAALRA